MQKRQPTLPEPHDQMLENYNLAIENMPAGQKSGHWDVFPEDYEKSIESIDEWKTFLRNPLSLGFNDTLIEFDNVRWSEHNKKHKDIDAWKRRKQHDYRELVGEIVEDKGEQSHILHTVNLLFSVCGPEFVIDNLQSDVGSPQKLPCSYKSNSNDEKPRGFYCNAHDLGNIYYFWQISRTADSLFNNESSLIAEIGAGYGGVISKVKKRYSKARCILFDLPELSAVQSYYIYNCFPGSNILYLNDLLERGDEIFEDDFDFMILPGWMIERLPSEYIDLVINMRSMMEMPLAVIDYYFHHIHRTVKIDGLFACFNRYHKNTFGEDIIMKKYPYDEFWSIIISQSSIYTRAYS